MKVKVSSDNIPPSSLLFLPCLPVVTRNSAKRLIKVWQGGGGGGRSQPTSQSGFLSILGQSGMTKKSFRHWRKDDVLSIIIPTDSLRALCQSMGHRLKGLADKSSIFFL